MDTQRAKRVFDKMSQATMKELESWDRVEHFALKIHEQPDLHKPIPRPEVKGFKFEQKFDPERAAAIQDEISDLLNTERWEKP